MAGQNKLAVTIRRMHIARELDAMCRSRSFDDISIEDICATTGVSRSTFYRTFEGKYAIASWCHSHPLEAGIGEMGRTLSCRDGIATTLEGMSLFRHLLASVSGAADLITVEESGRRDAATFIEETLREYHGVQITDVLARQIRWVTDAGVLATLRWFAEGCATPALEEAEFVAACFPDDLLKYLDNPTDPKPRMPMDLDRFMFLAL